MNVSHGRNPISMPPVGMAGFHGGRSGVRARGRALPIVVASGLAMGVFAGLIVVRGTGEADPAPAADAPAAPTSASAAATGPAASPAEPTQPATSSPATSSPPADSPATPSTPSADAPATPSTPSTPSPSAKVAVVSFSVKPRRAHIFVNGSELAGTSTDIALAGDSARIEVTIKARGHKSHIKTYTVTGDQKIEVSLRRDRRDEPSGPGGLLDIR